MKNLSKNQSQNGISENDLDFDVYAYEITDSTEVKPLEPIITIEESVFCAKSEISFISGKPKVGKTTIASILVSTCLTQNPKFDTLGFISHLQGTEKIIYLDTEQSPRSTNRILERIKRNLNVFAKPDNFKIFSFRPLNYLQIKKAFAKLLQDHPDTTLWVIDGIADMVNSVNDEKEAKELLQYLGKVATEFHCGMIVFLHENSTALNDKMRGHLGSEAQRKCFATISIAKDREKQLHTIKGVEFRESGYFQDIFFGYDKELKTFVRLDAEQLEALQQETKENKLNELYDLASVLKHEERVIHNELMKRIMKYKGISDKTAKNKISKMVENGIIRKEVTTEKYNNGKNVVFYYLPLPFP